MQHCLEGQCVNIDSGLLVSRQAALRSRGEERLPHVGAEMTLRFVLL